MKAHRNRLLSFPPSSPFPTSTTAHGNGHMADRAHGHLEHSLRVVPTDERSCQPAADLDFLLLGMR